MRSLMRRGKPEPATLSPPEPDSSIIEAANATIADLRDDLDDRAEQIEGLRDRCDDLFATGRRKDEGIAELRQEAATSEALIATLRAELAEAEAGAAVLQARCGEYENAIAWNTSCTACARTLDSSIAEHERAERAEQKVAVAVTALRPLAKLKGPTVADRARVVAQVIGGLEADGAEVIIP